MMMTLKQPKHWQDPANAVLGLWLVVSPWVVGFFDDSFASANAVIVGAALAAAAFGAMLVPQAWEEWTEAALGLWLVVSPWVLGFSALANATLTVVVSGVVVLALALWTLATDEQYRTWLRHLKAH
jgi:alkylation response protein AidB-like acyl-CoA dehydrogenase